MTIAAEDFVGEAVFEGEGGGGVPEEKPHERSNIGGRLGEEALTTNFKMRLAFWRCAA